MGFLDGLMDDSATTDDSGGFDNPAEGIPVFEQVAEAGDIVNKQFDDEPGGGAGDIAAGGTADTLFERPNEGANFWFGGIGADHEGFGDPDDPVGTDSVDVPGPTVSEGTEQAVEGVADVANDAAGFGLKQLLDNPVLLGITALAGVYVLGQLFDVEVGQ